MGERTNKDDFWQPEKSDRSCRRFSPKKMRKKERQPTQSALSHLAFSHTFTESGLDASSFTASASQEKLLLTLTSEIGGKKNRVREEEGVRREEWMRGLREDRSDINRKGEKRQLKGLNRELAHVSEVSLCWSGEHFSQRSTILLPTFLPFLPQSTPPSTPPFYFLVSMLLVELARHLAGPRGLTLRVH